MPSGHFSAMDRQLDQNFIARINRDVMSRDCRVWATKHDGALDQFNPKITGREPCDNNAVRLENTALSVMKHQLTILTVPSAARCSASCAGNSIRSPTL